MSASGGKKGHDRPHRRPPEEPDPTSAGDGEDESIEILEVVGVDETTGSEKGQRTPHHSPPPAPRRESPAGDLPRKLEEALEAKDKYYDLLLRKQAEFENFRKRVEKELHEARTSASADLVKSLLPVIDNLERGLESSQGSDGPLRQGLVLIHQQLVEFLKKAGLRPMETLGSSFDPRLHEAVQVMDVDGFEEGVILEEMQKGYTFNDRMLRPAMVKVASGRKPKGAAQAPGAGS